MQTWGGFGGAGGVSGVSGHGAGGPSIAIAHTGGAPVIGDSKTIIGKPGDGVPLATRHDASTNDDKTIPASPAGVAEAVHAF
jgi:hypothetical protein